MKRLRSLILPNELFLLLLFVLLTFSKGYNNRAILVYLRQAAVWFPAVLGQSLLLMTGICNLSTGGQIALLAELFWFGRLYGGLPVGVLVLLLAVFSLLLGGLYGWAGRYLKSLSLFTFGMNYVLAGPLYLLYMANRAVEAQGLSLENKRLGFLPPWAWVGLLAGLAAYCYLNHTTWGRSVMLAAQIGENQLPKVMDVRRINQVACMVGCMLIGLSGLLLALRADGVTSTEPLSYTYKVWTAAAIGGCLYPTRKNFVWKAAVGSIGLVVLNALTQHLGISSMGDYCISGVLLLVAFVAESIRNGSKKYGL